MQRMDDRTLGAVVSGLLLAEASARQVERAYVRAIESSARREVDRFGHLWWRRLSHVGAGVKGTRGLLVLFYAYRRYSATDTPIDGNESRDDE